MKLKALTAVTVLLISVTACAAANDDRDARPTTETMSTESEAPKNTEAATDTGLSSSAAQTEWQNLQATARVGQSTTLPDGLLFKNNIDQNLISTDGRVYAAPPHAPGSVDPRSLGAPPKTSHLPAPTPNQDLSGQVMKPNGDSFKPAPIFTPPYVEGIENDLPEAPSDELAATTVPSEAQNTDELESNSPPITGP